MKIAITGATGQLGQLVIQHLLKQTQANNIVALVRNVDKAAHLKAQGIELRHFDYDSPATLVPALQGIDKILLISANEVGRRTPQHKAVIDAASNAGARKVYLIEEPIAAAIGAGIDISKPCGNMIVDIGGGTTDIAVISLGGSVVSSSIKVAGDKFDEYIVKYIKKRHNVMIGERTAEELKQQIGCVFPKIQDMEMDVRGRDLITGLPKTITIYSSEMMEALEEPAMLIVDAVHSVLEKTPPELAADISDKGIYMTGGGCLIDGLDRLLQEKTGINVMIAEDAISCVAKGTGKALDNLDIMDKMRR